MNAHVHVLVIFLIRASKHTLVSELLLLLDWPTISAPTRTLVYSTSWSSLSLHLHAVVTFQPPFFLHLHHPQFFSTPMAQSASSTPTGSHNLTFNQTQWEATQAAIDAKIPTFTRGISSLKDQKPDTYTLDKRSDLNLWLFGVEQYLNFQDIPDELHFSYASTLLCGIAMALWHYHPQDAKMEVLHYLLLGNKFKAFLILAFQPIHPTKNFTGISSPILKQTTSI